MRSGPLAEAVMDAKTQEERWDAIRAYYVDLGPKIAEAGPSKWALGPYDVDWARFFTPIEYAFWQDIRSVGAVMYPQYPIGPYFADFANPCWRVVIECDGAQFHRNAAKDAKRDAYMRGLGWRVHRLIGVKCLENGATEDEDGSEVEGDSPGVRLLRSLGLPNVKSFR